MRIVLTIALLSLYIVLTAGFQILLHTCGGETTVHAFPVSTEDPCGCSDMPQQDRCCTTQVITIHLDDVQQGASMSPAPPDQTPVLTLAVVHVVPDHRPALSAPHTIDTSPPSQVAPHILHCTFLI